ncbi:hypothetical protein ScPMuIL_012519 [Solemya velum]
MRKNLVVDLGDSWPSVRALDLREVRTWTKLETSISNIAITALPPIEIQRTEPVSTDILLPKMSEGPPTPKRMRLDVEDLQSMSKEELIEKLKEQERYLRLVEDKTKNRPFEAGDEVDLEEKLKQQQKEAQRRENTLVHRLTLKEGELQDYMNQIQEMKQAQAQSTSQLRSMLLDPTINLVFQRMMKEMEESQEKLKQTQNELSAWKFTPDSQTGKRLMVKCRLLLQENEDLGKVIASGRTAKLEGEIALQKQVVQDMKKNQTELDEFLADLEEEVEGMQSMIYILQQQLIETKEQVTKLQQENDHLRTSHTNVPESDNYPNKKSCTPEWTEKDSQHKQETDLDLTVSSSEQWGKSRDTDSRDRESPLKGISETVVDTSSMEMDHEVSDHQIRTKIEEMETEPCMETDGQNCITNHSDVADSITKYEIQII